MYAFFIEYLLPPLSTLIIGLITYGIGLLTKFLLGKIKNENLRNLTETVLTIATNATKATFQSFVDSIKGTTEWNEETQEKARQMTLTTIKEELTDKAYKYIQDTHGDVDKYLLNLIHSIIYDLKNPKKVENQSAQ